MSLDNLTSVNYKGKNENYCCYLEKKTILKTMQVFMILIDKIKEKPKSK